MPSSRGERQRAGADDDHRQHAEHAIHQDRCGGLGEMDIAARERVRRGTCPRRRSGTKLLTKELTKKIRSTRPNGGREPGVKATSRSIQRSAIRDRSTRTSRARRSEPAQIGAAVTRMTSGRDVRCREQSRSGQPRRGFEESAARTQSTAPARPLAASRDADRGSRFTL